MNEENINEVNLVLPLFYFKSKKNLDKDMCVTYCKDSLYIFCKNFEIILAKSYYFEFLRNYAFDDFLNYCRSLATEILHMGYSSNDILNCSEDFTEVTSVDYENDENKIVKILKDLKQFQLNKILVKFSPLFQLCSDDEILLLTVFVNELLINVEVLNNCSFFEIYDYLLANYPIFSKVIDKIEITCKSLIGKTINYSVNEFLNIPLLNLLCMNTVFFNNEVFIDDVEVNTILSLGQNLNEIPSLNLFFKKNSECDTLDFKVWERDLILLYDYKNLLNRERTYLEISSYLFRKEGTKDYVNLYSLERRIIYTIFNQENSGIINLLTSKGISFDSISLECLLELYLQMSCENTKEAKEFYECRNNYLNTMDVF